MNDLDDKLTTPSDEKSTSSVPNVRRRRLFLYAFALIALAVISVFAVRTLTADDKPDPAAKRPQVERPLIVERFRLTAAKGQIGRGLGELVRRKAGDGLRVLAIDLAPSKGEDFYQLLLSKGDDTRVLGNQVVDDQKTFVGEAKITSAELRKFDRIELRRVTPGSPPESKLVLRGKISK